MTSHEILLAVLKKANGDWNAAFDIIKNKGDISKEDVPEETLLGGWKPITIVDGEYPKALKEGSYRPPFALFCKGDVSLLDREMLGIIPDPDQSEMPAGVKNLISDLAAKRLPTLLLYRARGSKGQAADVVAAYREAGTPLTVVIPMGCPNRDRLADGVAASGGLAITEDLPWNGSREKDRTVGRIAAGASKAVLVLGGGRGGFGSVDVGFALNAGKDVGAVAREIGDPNGWLCHMVASNGGTVITSTDDVYDFLADGWATDLERSGGKA